MHILLIVDDMASRNNLKWHLEHAGLKVTATAITEAVEGNVPETDAALLDLNIEKVPDDDVVKGLAQIAKSTPTLVLYGNHLEAEMKALLLGKCEMMHKKCSVSDIIEKLEGFRHTSLKAA